MEVLSFLLFTLALNVDALGVGISYGMRGIKVSPGSMLIIAAISMTVISLSMLVGQVLVKYISPSAARHTGGFILMLIGLWAIYQYYHQKKYSTEEYQAGSSQTAEQVREPVSLLQIKVLGLIIQVIRHPHLADVDLSGSISGREAVLLGLSLSMDSLGAGIAIAFLGYSVLITALCVGTCQILFTNLGFVAGKGLNRCFSSPQIAVLPGLILIILGIIRLY